MDLGLDILYMNHEFFPSQYEINWKHDEALKIADDSFTFKYVCKEMAAQNNLHLTFMGRPTTDGGGSGYHIHLSLSDPETRKNLFDDPAGQHGISDLTRYFIGGQMAHAKGMSALFAPTINSYKRYVPDSFAPYYLPGDWTTARSIAAFPVRKVRQPGWKTAPPVPRPTLI